MNICGSLISKLLRSSCYRGLTSQADEVAIIWRLSLVLFLRKHPSALARNRAAKSPEHVRKIKRSLHPVKPFSPGVFYLRPPTLPGQEQLLFLLTEREAGIGTIPNPHGHAPNNLPDTLWCLVWVNLYVKDIYSLNCATYCPTILIPSSSMPLLGPASRAQLSFRLTSLAGSHLNPVSNYSDTHY